MSEWQDISTAPRDGTCFLAIDDRIGGGFYQVVSMAETDKPWIWEVDDGVRYHEGAFTHWQPLPTPPHTGKE